jgi:tetratricopeptide (TPR) repeat protein
VTIRARLALAFVAIGALAGVAAPESTNESTHMEQGFACVQSGNVTGAVEHFEAALRSEPNNRKVATALGAAYAQVGLDRQAVQVLEPVVKAEPANYLAKNNLAWVLATTEDSGVRDGRRALQLARETLALAPNDFHVMNTVSEAEYVCGRYEEALRMAESALTAAAGASQGAVPPTYREQVEKCRQAVQAFQLAE